MILDLCKMEKRWMALLDKRGETVGLEFAGGEYNRGQSHSAGDHRGSPRQCQA